MTARNRTASTPTRRRGGTARLAAAIALAALIVLFATGCGRHFHITYHASRQPGATRLVG